MGIEAYFFVLALASLILFSRDAWEDFNGPKTNPLPSWNVGLMTFLYFLCIVGALYLAFAAGAMTLTEAWKNNPVLKPWRVPVSGIASQAGMLAGLVVTLRLASGYGSWEPQESPPSEALTPARNAFQFNAAKLKIRECIVRGLIGMLAAMPVMMLAGFLWYQALELLSELGYRVNLERQPLLDIMNTDAGISVFVALVFLAVVVAPIVEELVFRGVVYRYLKGVFSPRAGMVFSSLFFSLIHLNLLSFIPLFLLGMLLCRVYEKSKNICVPIAMHAFFNANSVLSNVLAPQLDALK